MSMLTVVLETGTGGVCFGAHRTLKRPLACVCTKVNCKITLLGECFLAPVTLVGPLSGVRSNVNY